MSSFIKRKKINPERFKGHIVAAWADPACGPGWSNRPIYVLVQDENTQVRLEALQPNEQTEELLTLYNISAEVHEAMAGAVRRAVTPKRRTNAT
jgi:hypothetical protein